MSRPTVIHVPAWGAFVEHAEHEALTCLSAPGQLEALRELGDVTLICSTCTDNRLWGLPTDIEVVVSDLGPEPTTPQGHRLLQTQAEALSFNAARALGADWIPLCADHVFPERHLARVKQRLLSGERAVVGTCLKAQRASYLKNTTRAETAAAQVALTLWYLHPSMQDYALTHPPRRLTANPHMALFNDGRELAVRAGQLAIFGVATGELEYAPSLADYQDCRLLASIPSEHLGFVSDPVAAGIALTGLEDAPSVFGDFEMTVDELARTALIFCRTEADLAHWRWAFTHRVTYPAPNGFPVSLSENETVAALMTRLA